MDNFTIWHYFERPELSLLEDGRIFDKHRIRTDTLVAAWQPQRHKDGRSCGNKPASWRTK